MEKDLIFAKIVINLLRHQDISKNIHVDIEMTGSINQIDRPYICDICGKNFFRSSTMKTHKNRHYKPINGNSKSVLPVYYKIIQKLPSTTNSNTNGVKEIHEAPKNIVIPPFTPWTIPLPSLLAFNPALNLYSPRGITGNEPRAVPSLIKLINGSAFHSNYGMTLFNNSETEHNNLSFRINNYGINTNKR